MHVTCCCDKLYVTYHTLILETRYSIHDRNQFNCIEISNNIKLHSRSEPGKTSQNIYKVNTVLLFPYNNQIICINNNLLIHYISINYMHLCTIAQPVFLVYACICDQCNLTSYHHSVLLAYATNGFIMR